MVACVYLSPVGLHVLGKTTSFYSCFKKSNRVTSNGTTFSSSSAHHVRFKNFFTIGVSLNLMTKPSIYDVGGASMHCTKIEMDIKVFID